MPAGRAVLDRTGDAPSSPAPTDESAQLPASPEAPREAATAPDQTTTDTPAGQQDDPVAKLTPEQKARILREADPEELARVNDRLNGYVGKRLQVERAEAARADRERAIRDARQAALTSKDPDAALAALEAQTDAETEATHQAAWADAVGTYQALEGNPLTKPIVDGLAGRDYGRLSGNNGTLASLMYKADLADNLVKTLPEWEKSMRAEIEKKLRPIIEREVKAKALGEEPSPDLGSGGAPGSGAFAWRTLGEATAAVRKMTPAQYAQHETEIDAVLARLSRRSRGAA